MWCTQTLTYQLCSDDLPVFSSIFSFFNLLSASKKILQMQPTSSVQCCLHSRLWSRWMQMMLHADIFGIQTADRQCFSLTFCYLHNNNVQKSVAAVGKGPSASAWHRLANAHSEQFAICLLELWPRVDKSSEPSAKNLSAFLRTFALLGMQSKRQCGGSHWQRSTVTYLMQLCFLWIPHCEIEVRWRAWCGSACGQDRGGGSFIWSFDFVWTGGQVTLRTQTFV